MIVWGFIEWLEIILFSAVLIIGLTVTVCIYYILYMYCMVVHTLETIITVWHRPNCYTKWDGQLDYICMDKKADKINKVSCIVLFTKIWRQDMWNEALLCTWITGSGNQKLAMSWIMWSLAMLLHIVLSLAVCSYVIRFSARNNSRPLSIFRPISAFSQPKFILVSQILVYFQWGQQSVT